MNKRIVSIIILSLACNVLVAQNVTSSQQYNENVAILKADGKFKQKNFADAYNDYSMIIKNHLNIAPHDYTPDNGHDAIVDCYWNRAMCAYYLMNNDVDVLFNEFITLFPNSERVNRAIFYTANWYIQKNEYSKALETYQTIDVESLPTSEYLEYYYKIGYCLFLNGSYERALSSFEKVKDSESVYSSPSKYYHAHILYLKGMYQQALTEFEQLKKDKYFKHVVPYYICQIYYLNEDYDKLIEMAPQLSEKALNSKREAELNRMLGDAYYKKGQYSDALPYIKRSIESNPAVNRDDNYLMGYCLMQTGDFNSAIEYLNKTTTQNDKMGQNASYYLGYCYLQQKDTLMSKNSYKAASTMTFDKIIQEESLWNYAKLCVNEPGPYNDAIKNLTTFINRYPNSSKNTQAKNYLIQLYERTKNYKDALTLLDQMKNNTKQMNEIYQKIALMRSIELYNSNKFNDAIVTIDKSLKYPVNNSYTAYAYYLKAESLYNLNDFNGSISALNKYYSVPKQKNNTSLQYPANPEYTMAYNLFKQHKYALAKNYFNKVITNYENNNPQNYNNTTINNNSQTQASVSKNIAYDSKLRLADCEYMLKNFANAITYYNEVISYPISNSSDYAYYQLAMSQGALGNHKTKCQTLQTAISKFNTSTYKPNMIFELANTYLALEQNSKALETYEQLVNEYPQSADVKESLGKIGMLSYLAGDYDNALKNLDKLVKQYPNSAESKAALSTIKNIYMERNMTDEYFAYVKSIGNITVTNEEKEQMLYQTAENQYMDGNYKQAVSSFEKYLQSFDKSTNSDKAKYYLADCLIHTGDTVTAINYYTELALKPTAWYTEKSLKIAAPYYQIHDKSQAIILYTLWDSVTSSQTSKLQAETALMGLYYDNQSYNSAISYAQKILSTNGISKDLSDNANLTVADCYMALNDNKQAEEYYKKTAESDNGAIAGKSLYYLALIEFDNGNITESEKIIRAFSSSQNDDYWLAKAFILWSDIFVAKGNDFQAKQTLQSIIDNYDNEQVIADAQQKFDALEMKNKQQEEQNDKIQKEQDESVDEIIVP